MDKKCLICGNVFTPRNAQAKYCCNECREIAKKNTTKRWYQNCGKKANHKPAKRTADNSFHVSLPKKPPKGYKSWADVEIEEESNLYRNMISRTTSYRSAVPKQTKEQRKNEFMKLVNQFDSIG